MRQITSRSFIKWGLITSAFFVIACSVERDLRYKTKTSRIRLKVNKPHTYHFKTGDYIISVNDSIGKMLENRYTLREDPSPIKNDTIDLELTDTYWVEVPINRVLRDCIEKKDVNIYSISQSTYITKVKRIASKIEGMHSRYIFTDKLDTILFASSPYMGTPPF